MKCPSILRYGYPIIGLVLFGLCFLFILEPRVTDFLYGLIDKVSIKSFFPHGAFVITKPLFNWLTGPGSWGFGKILLCIPSVVAILVLAVIDIVWIVIKFVTSVILWFLCGIIVTVLTFVIEYVAPIVVTGWTSVMHVALARNKKIKASVSIPSGIFSLIFLSLTIVSYILIF